VSGVRLRMKLRRTAVALAEAVSRTRDQEPATAGVGFADDLEARGRVLRTFDHHVLQQIAETRLDRALVAGFDFEVIGDGALLVDLAVGLRQHRTRRVAVTGAGRLELLERFQPCFDARELVLARTDRSRAPLVLDARARQF